MAGLPSGSGTPTSLPSLHPGSQPPLLHGASSREQAEMLQRELYSRAYMDPSLAHQVCVVITVAPIALAVSQLHGYRSKVPLAGNLELSRFCGFPLLLRTLPL